MNKDKIKMLFGSNLETEEDVIIECIGIISQINCVIDIKRLGVIETYLYEKLQNLKSEEK